MNYSIGAALLGTALVASIACAEPFTYQGVLQEAGMAADGAYDIRFELYDSVGKSIQLGATLTFDDVAVSGGTFSVDLDFGSGMFDGSDRFLFIEVRDGASTGGYTGLLPAIAITATPEAQHAITADIANTAVALLNPQWIEAPGVLTYGDGNDRVFINRSSPITTAEYFGVHADTAGFVGMYVSGLANSKPFYGYSIDDQISAFTYVNPNNSAWVLVNNNATALESDSSGNLTVAGDTVADSFQYSSPKTSYISISGTAFHSISNVPFSAIGSGVYSSSTGSNVLSAPIQIPHGATVVKMTAYCSDSNSAGLTVSLGLNLLGFNGGSTMASVSTANVTGQGIVLVDATISQPLIDNTNSAYRVLVSSNNWSGGDSTSLDGLVIEYTTPEAN